MTGSETIFCEPLPTKLAKDKLGVQTPTDSYHGIKILWWPCDIHVNSAHMHPLTAGMAGQKLNVPTLLMSKCPQGHHWLGSGGARLDTRSLVSYFGAFSAIVVDEEGKWNTKRGKIFEVKAA